MPFSFILKKNYGEAGEMALWLRALTALPEILSSNPSNHMVAHTQMSPLLAHLKTATVYLGMIIHKPAGYGGTHL